MLFQAPDCLIPDLVTLLQECVEKEQNSCPEQLKLEAYISPNFMGFFLNEDCENKFKIDVWVSIIELSNYNGFKVKVIKNELSLKCNFVDRWLQLLVNWNQYILIALNLSFKLYIWFRNCNNVCS